MKITIPNATILSKTCWECGEMILLDDQEGRQPWEIEVCPPCDRFHFYEEVFDKDAVYLELNDDHVGAKEKPIVFEAGPRSVTIRIPVEIWECIREHRS